MRPATTDRVLLDGAAGTIEVDISDPGDARRGIALIAHPHPLMGGTKDNKVVTTLARTFHALGCVTLRPNFRGVGASAGVHDQGVAETDDLVIVARYAKDKIKSLGLSGPGKVRVNMAGCLDRCEEGPVLVVYPEEVWYTYVDREDIDEIVSEHLQNGRVVERLKI